MSRPVSSGESLEAILASIRRSLAEQATDSLEDEPAAAPAAAPEALPETPPGDFDAPPVSEESPAWPFAAAAPEAPGGSGVAGAGGLEPATAPAETPARAPVAAVASAPAPQPDPAPAPAAEEPAPAPEPASAPVSAHAGQKDPLWFLGQEAAQKAATPAAAAPVAERKPAPDSARQMPPASAPVPPRAAEARPSRASSRASSLRAPLPPFFGSSAETVQVEIAPDPPVLPSNGAVNGAVPPESVPPAPAPAPAPAPRLNGAAYNGGGPGGPQPVPRPADAQLNGTASAIFAQQAVADAKTAAAEALPQMPGLEAMVAELLRPMLRKWLDENMPRLVSAALEAELRSRQEPGKP